MIVVTSDKALRAAMQAEGMNFFVPKQVIRTE